MALMKISSSGGDFQEADVGLYPAVCVNVIDIGTQTGEYNGKPTHKRQIIIGFELHGESVTTDGVGYMKDENGNPDPKKPFMASAWVTASFHEESTLRKYMESWRGVPFSDDDIHRFETEGFDWSLMLGKPCMVKMAKNAKGKTKLAGVERFQKNLTPSQPVNPTYAFVLDDFNPDVFEKVPDGIKEFIRKSPEWAALNGKSMNDFSQGNEVEEPPFNDNDTPF